MVGKHMKELNRIALSLLTVGAFLCLINPLFVDYAKKAFYYFAIITMLAGIFMLMVVSLKEYKKCNHMTTIALL
jgi:hypothetical protein